MHESHSFLGFSARGIVVIIIIITIIIQLSILI